MKKKIALFAMLIVTVCYAISYSNNHGKAVFLSPINGKLDTIDIETPAPFKSGMEVTLQQCRPVSGKPTPWTIILSQEEISGDTIIQTYFDNPNAWSDEDPGTSGEIEYRMAKLL